MSKTITLRPQTLNGWNYVEGNPINLTDPSGLCSKLPQLGPSDCEKFVAEVAQFITQAQNNPQLLGVSTVDYFLRLPQNLFKVDPIFKIRDDYTVAMLGAYYSNFMLTANLGSQELLIPPPFLPNVLSGRQERWALGFNRQAAYSLDKYHPDYKEYLEAQAEAFALSYGFKRAFYDNTHHYFANFYVAWFANAPTAQLGNALWEQFNVRQSRNLAREALDSAADEVVIEVAINHMRQTKGWFYNDLSLLPSLIEKDLCGDTIEEIYQGWQGIQ